ncbi:MAG: hypothetical protein ACYC6B_08665 [Thermoleophilia bacterium]
MTNEQEHPGAAATEEDRFAEELELSEEREDERWNAANQFNDWVLLICLGIFQATWMIIVIVFEPGIR